MNPSGNEPWHPPGGGSAVHQPVDQHGQGPQRPYNSFGPNPPQPPQGTSQPGGPVLPPPGSFFPGSQPPTHALPSLADLNPPPPSHQQLQGPPPPHQQTMASAQLAQPPQPGPGHSLPGLGHTMQQSPPSSASRDREREAREREYREREIERDREMRERQRQDDFRERERAEREREQREREHIERQREQQQQQQHPVQNHTGSIPLQQPVAVKAQNSFTGPNGILSNMGASVSQGPQQGALPPHNGMGGMFNNPLPNDGVPRSFGPHVGQGPPIGFGGQGQPQMGGGVAALAQGQQPILNDALSYLDQVKVRFSEQPDVYNKFLDIMKDFKSQAIDTPGVIDRVSSLFTGHPMLIQGFNTFLPPGYRIECGTDDNPNAIRVTTPQGSRLTSMQPRPLQGDPLGIPGTSLQQLHERDRQMWTQPLAIQHADALSPNGRLGGPGLFNQQSAPSQESQMDYQQTEQASNAAALAHQQEQRGVSQLQNAVSAATNGTPSRPSMMQASPGSGQPANLAQPVSGLSAMNSGTMTPGQVGLEKRGPVEFNHAISYVNKIKNRFATQPEIYKQFLEILQTYQRESKPIQDVYAQVTQLFSTAPDLLEDFKQFLPESAAQAKAQQMAARQAAEEAAVTSSVRGEPYPSGGQINQAQTPRNDAKVPPIGNFAPPSAAKDGKKHRRTGLGAQTTTTTSSTQLVTPQADAVGALGSRVTGPQVGSVNKRAKTHHAKPPMADGVAVSPTLVPQPPQPLPPLPPNISTDDFQFFDRVKKFIGNKNSYAEFLKLCNMYVNELLDKNPFFERASSFISGNPDLMAYFERMIHREGDKRDVFVPKARPSTGRINLAHCRGLGPSYRLLPKRERLKICSGRDDLCRQVLNDEWASHPTWASEDSGFVAHRKNQYEETMHRIEEERHDYDFNIEACLRTIQLIEPIVLNLKHMTQEERDAYVLHPGLGGQSETIYQRVVKKIYDRERGQKVLDDMFARPAAVLPIVLQRLKQKAEEWKVGQREWDKVWREMTQKNFYKSLDHQGLIIKAIDKKLFTPKGLQNEITTAYEQQQKARVKSLDAPKYQLSFTFKDMAVVMDTAHMLLVYLRAAFPPSTPDNIKMESWVKEFIPLFFDIDPNKFNAHIANIDAGTPPNEDADEDTPTPDGASSRGRRAAAAKKQDLRRGLLDRRNGDLSRNEGSNVGSKESTPDVSSAVEDDIPGTESPVEDAGSTDVTNNKWMDHPPLGNMRNQRDIGLTTPYKRETYNMYSNGQMYTFMRLFEILYERLLGIKDEEDDVQEDARRSNMPKAADGLGIADKSARELFKHPYDELRYDSYYTRIRAMVEDFLKNSEPSLPSIEDILRRFYPKSGAKLHTIDKLAFALAKAAQSIVTNDVKDKSWEIMYLFMRDREKEETTHAAEVQIRKQAEKFCKEGEMYRITYTPRTGFMTSQILRRDDNTFEMDDLTSEARWSYYVSTYTMRDPTEGVPMHMLRMPFLKRNLPPRTESEDEYNEKYLPVDHKDSLIIRICTNSYHILYEPDTADWWVHSTQIRGVVSEEKMMKIRESRKSKLNDKFVMNAAWMKDQSRDFVDGVKEDFRQWIENGKPKETVEGDQAAQNDDMVDDVE